MRCAICFVPPPEDALTQAAAHWLRRDPFSGARLCRTVEGLVDEDHAFVTALPRRMGFHGALKPIFCLAPRHDIAALDRALANFCSTVAPVALPEMRIGLVDSHFALMPARPSPELDELAAEIVIGFDAFRSPLTEEELVRGAARLDARQFANIVAWGHPDVLDRFRFRMALTGPVDRLERDHVALVLARHFGALATTGLIISQLVLLIEPENNATFLVHSAHRLTAGRRQRSA